MARTVSVEAIDDKIEEVLSHYILLSREIQKESGLNSSAVVIMELLGEDHLSLKEITERSTLDKSTLSRQVNQLVKKEWVIRETGKDKRYVKFSVTEEGKNKHLDYLKRKNKKMADLLISWTEEEKQLLYVLLGRMGRSLKQMIEIE